MNDLPPPVFDADLERPLDLLKEFRFDVNDDFPPPLFVRELPPDFDEAEISNIFFLGLGIIECI